MGGGRGRGKKRRVRFGEEHNVIMGEEEQTTVCRGKGVYNGRKKNQNRSSPKKRGGGDACRCNLSKKNTKREKEKRFEQEGRSESTGWQTVGHN